jgi:phosphatidylserine/phosphatidylglycerophosphate/cardiolipin synthase-like enzyme
VTQFADGEIEAFVGPQELGAADNLEDVIVSFIEGARESLDIAVQEIDSMPIAQAIIDARWRGVSVRAIVEQDYLEDKDLPKVKTAPGESEEEARARAQWSRDPPVELDVNRYILAALLRNHVHVTADYNPEIFHQKFVVRDYRTGALPNSALLTGSANFTHTDTHMNYNHVVVFNDALICRSYQTEFQQITSGSFGRNGHGNVPSTYNLSGVPVKVLFAPDHTPELEIIKQMLKCTNRLDFAIFTFAGSSGIDDAMVMLRRADRELRGALDPAQGRQWWAATKWLHDEDIKVFFPKRIPGFRKLHHKLMVIDDAIAIAGSFNYTAPANEYNDENIFVMGSPYPNLPQSEGGPVDMDKCAEITAFFRAEIDRIIGLSQPYQA